MKAIVKMLLKMLDKYLLWKRFVKRGGILAHPQFLLEGWFFFTWANHSPTLQTAVI